jgi:hypothetical protein
MGTNSRGPDTEEVQFGFVLGTGRCGSTLVHEVLARHPDVGFVSNVEDRIPKLNAAWRWNRILYGDLLLSFARKGRLRYAPSEGYRVLDQRVAPVLSHSCRDLTADDATPWLTTRLKDFFESRARSQRKPLFLHKFTGWPRAGLLQNVFPKARFVHVMRDGRAVANSGLQIPWFDYAGPPSWLWGPLPPAYQAEWESSGRSFVILAGLAWKLLMDALDDARSKLPPDCWLDVRYEDIVADPRATFHEMLSFLGLSWTRAFETRFNRYHFSPRRLDAYRRELNSSQIASLEVSLTGHLRQLGYPVQRQIRGVGGAQV